MNRRGFLKNLGVGAAAVAVAPVIASVLAALPEATPAVSVNPSFRWYTGYDSFTPPTSADVLDAAEFQWKQLGNFVSISSVDKMAPNRYLTAHDLRLPRRHQIGFAAWERSFMNSMV